MNLQITSKIEQIESEINHWRQAGEKLKEANTISHLSAVYFSAGEFAKSIEWLEQELTLRRDLQDVAGGGERTAQYWSYVQFYGQ